MTDATPKSEDTTTEFQRRKEAASVHFASDYGPLPAAMRGEAKARTTVMQRLDDILARNGLKIVEIEEQ